MTRENGTGFGNSIINLRGKERGTTSIELDYLSYMSFIGKWGTVISLSNRYSLISEREDYTEPSHFKVF